MCGYTAEFVAEAGHTLRVSGTDRRYAASSAQINDFYRFEGTSDPDDMSVIYALETDDGTRARSSTPLAPMPVPISPPSSTG